MNLPIQSQPITRTPVKMMPASPSYEVLPSGDGCPSNYWCCTNNSSSWCIYCGGPGFCVTPQTDFCQSYGLHPSDQC